MGLGRYSLGTASGLIVATGAVDALIWACRWTHATHRAVIERLRVNAVVTATITTAVPYDLAAYFASAFTVFAPSTGVAATLTKNKRKTAGIDESSMSAIYTLNTAAAGMSTRTEIVKAGVYRWTASAAGGAGVFYCELNAGGNPNLASPSAVRASGVDMTLASAVAALPAGNYWYGDGDTLGFSTVYVKLADSTDPDTKSDGYVEHFVGAVFTPDTHPLARISGLTGTVVGTQFFGAAPAPLIDYQRDSDDLDGKGAIVLGQNEGIALRAPLAGPATGTFRVCVNLDWREI